MSRYPETKVMSTSILYACLSLLSLYSLFISPFPLDAQEQPNSQVVAAKSISQAPAYSVLYDQLLMLEQEGSFVEALRIIPKIYGTEIPVESFYGTLENKRNQLLKTISQKEISFLIGRDIYTFLDLRQLFRHLYLSKPLSYRQLIDISGDLDVNRFSYFMILEGQKQKDSISQRDMQPAINKADPWLVAGALFIDRRQKKHAVAPQDIIDRWQSRPDLWDEECTKQALLFLAQFDTAAIKALEITNDDIRLQVERLHQVSNDKCYIAPLLYSAYGEDVSYFSTFTGTLIQLRNKKTYKGEVKRWAGDTNHYSALEPFMEKKIKARHFTNGAIPVEPGQYQLRFNSVNGSPPAGFYGKSAILEVKRGKLVVIPLALTPAI